MSDENEYSGSGHFVGESEQAAPKAAKKSSVAERQVVKNNDAPVAEAKNVDQQQVGQNAVAISDAMGNPQPPIGDVLTGVGKQLAPYAIGGATMLGLKKAWDVLSSQQAQTSNDGAKGGWDRTTAGKPANAALGAAPAPEAAPVPAAATTATPIPEAAPKAAAVPAATFPATATQQPSISGYGTTTTNAPTGAPNVAVAPPAEVAPAPVQPMTKEQRDQISWERSEARKAELHANKLAADAKRAEGKIQKSQGQSISAGDAALVKQGAKNTIINAADAGVKALAKTTPPATSVAPPAPNLATPAQAPATVAEAQAKGPAIGTPQEVAKASTPAPTEGIAPPKWRGGSEGSALQLFGATKKTLEPKHMAGLEVFKDFVGGELAPSTGGTIKEFPQFTEFFKKHTGETLSPNAEGKYPRLTESQVSKLHSGIRSELEDAVKGGKLKNLGKGAMAAAALLGLTGAVQAAQKGDFGPLEEAGFSGLLAKAVGGTAATLLTPGEAAAPTVGFTKQEQQTREVAQRPGVRAYAEILKNRLSGEEFNKAISDFAATNPKRGDYAAMQELFRQQAEAKKAKK